MRNKKKISRYIHTFRFLKPIQIFYRLYYVFKKPKICITQFPRLQPRSNLWKKSIIKPLCFAPPDSFSFLNQTHVVRFPQDWNSRSIEKLWLYNLHYFDCLNSNHAAEHLMGEAERLNVHNVQFTRQIPHHVIPSCIEACNACLVHLKKSELFAEVIPSKIFECLALEVPIIMGVEGYAQEIVLAAKGGIIMEPEDEYSLIDCITEIKDMRVEYTGARQYCELHCNREVLARKMLSVFEEFK